jgi:DNA-directed RNA polymerase subunit RPC12/RpoP
MARLDCPNPNCRKRFEVYETEVFDCSGCGTRIVVATEVADYEKAVARQRSRQESTHIQRKRLARLKVIGIAVLPMIAGFLLRSVAPFIGLALIFCLAWGCLSRSRGETPIPESSRGCPVCNAPDGKHTGRSGESPISPV